MRLLQIPIFNHHRIILTILAWLCIFNTNYAQNIQEQGYLDITNYSPKTYRAAAQNWCIVQDNRGVIYVANNDGVLEYDGNNWVLIKTSNDNTAKSLAVDSKGRVYVGGTGELGYLAPDSTGKMAYFSLLKYLPESERVFEEIWKTYTLKNDVVYFQSSNRIFRWDGKRFKTWNASKSFHQMFQVNDRIFVTQRDIGLMSFVDSNLVLLQGGEVLAPERVYFMLPYKEDKVLICTRSHGLYLLQPTPPDYFPSNRKEPLEFLKITPFNSPLNDFFIKNLVYNGISIGNNLYSVGTITSGVTVIDTTGQLQFSINKTSGLQDATIYNQFFDKEGKLWLALNKGIAKVDVQPLTRFNDKNGIESSTRAVCRHNGTIYVATRVGIYYLEKKKNIFDDQESLEHSHFIPVNSPSNEYWDLLSFNTPEGKSTLLVATTNGLMEYKNNTSLVAIPHNPMITMTIYRSRFDTMRVFVGLAEDKGVASFYYKNGKWEEEGRIPDVTGTFRFITEDEKGILWLGSENNGVSRVELIIKDKKIVDANSTTYTNEKGLADAGAFVHFAGGKVLFGTTKGLYRFNENSKSFEADTTFGSEFTDGTYMIYGIKEDAKGKIWMETVYKKEYHFGYMQKMPNGRYQWNHLPFRGIKNDILYTIFHDINAITWMGGAEGVYRFDQNKTKNYAVPFKTIIRKVVVGKDSVIFSGVFGGFNQFPLDSQAEKEVPVLSYDFNSFTFTFSATSFENEKTNEYSYYLEGFSKNWSNWSTENKAVFTNIPEGQYAFRVKARNVYSTESSEAVYTLTILSPWYRTTWAYIFYVLALGALVYGAVEFSTRRLKAIIADRTAEIVEQKEVIELKNKDITDSINYAKRIQEAMLPIKEYVDTLIPNSFILYKPKDIVSGDFYWATEKDGKVLVAAADCTGHGVPGAFMSMIGISLLNEIVNDKGITKPSSILELLRKGIINALKQTGAEGENKDGMDIALCCIDFKTRQVQYAGAYNPLVVIHGTDVNEIKADKCPIGISIHEISFTNHELTLQPGDTIYIFSDGYADQFGGSEGKKLMRKKMKDLFLNMQSLDMPNQGRYLNSALTEWQGSFSQVDDILVIGIKI